MANWLFANITHVVWAKLTFACAEISGSFKFRENWLWGFGVSAGRKSPPLFWLVAYTTARI